MKHITKRCVLTISVMGTTVVLKQKSLKGKNRRLYTKQNFEHKPVYWEALSSKVPNWSRQQERGYP